MKGAKPIINIMLIVFPEKFLFGANGYFEPKKWRVVITLDPLKFEDSFFLKK